MDYQPLDPATDTAFVQVTRYMLLRTSMPLITSLRGGAQAFFGQLVAAMWMEATADVNAPALDGCTPLWFAARTGERDCVQLLLEAGANKDAINERNNLTVLGAAALYNRVEVVRLLLA